MNLFDDRTKEGSIELVDLDGSNLRKVPLPPGRWNLHVCDWQRLTPGLRAQSVDQPPDLKTTRGRYQALIEEYKTAFKAYDQAHENAKTPEDRRRPTEKSTLSLDRISAGSWRSPSRRPRKRLPSNALIWVVQRGFDGPEYDRAIDLLVTPGRNRKSGSRCSGGLLGVAVDGTAASARLSRRILTYTPGDSPACGWASISSISPNGFAASARTPKSARRWEAMYLEEGAGKESFTRFIERDPDALMKRAEAALERTLKEFASEPADDRLSRAARAKLAEDARAELDEIRNLAVGKPAPEITGTDIDGRRSS